MELTPALRVAISVGKQTIRFGNDTLRNSVMTYYFACIGCPIPIVFRYHPKPQPMRLYCESQLTALEPHTPDLFAAPEPIYFQADPRFTTPHEYTVAKRIAQCLGCLFGTCSCQSEKQGVFPFGTSTLRHFGRLSAVEAQCRRSSG
jgi:hypothetical protein